MAAVDGTTGNDTVTGTVGNDTLNGLGGNDLLLGLGGDDVFNAGEGNDTLRPGLGNATLNGGDGTDTADLSGIALNVSLIITFGSGSALSDLFLLDAQLTSIENLVFGPGNDQVVGDVNPNRIDGGDGADSLRAGGGNDSLDGGGGDDTLDGGPGDDFLVGGAGINTINDAGGNDTVSYEAESSGVVFAADRTVTHTGGVDTVAASIEQINGTPFNDGLVGSDLNDRFLGFSGNDNLNAFGGNDLLNGGRGNDSFNGGSDNDTLIGGPGDDFFIPETGNNLVDATQGQDFVFFGFSASPITVNPDNTVVHDNGSIDTILGSAAIFGTPFDDLFNGGSGNDSFDGSNGNDAMVGGGGDDSLIGGIGNDILDAGAGASAILIGGRDNDVLNGGTTLAAMASYATSLAGIVVDAAANMVQDGLGGNDTLVGINAILGSTKNDTMMAGDGLDRLVELYGGGGDDSFVGGGFGLSPTGLVRVRYDLESAPIILTLVGQAAFRGANTDVLSDIHDVVATRFADQITDSLGTDLIDAGDGDDQIEVVGGNDTIHAGAGNDTVALALVTGQAVVDLGSGDDDLSIIELVGTAAPPQAGSASASTVWQAVDATTLMATSSFDGDTLGSATFGKGGGTLTIELDAFDQEFAIAAYTGALLLHPQGNLTGTLGMGDDTVIAAAGTYNLDGGGGINTIDYSIAGGIAITFSGNQATVTAGVITQTLQRFLRFVGSPGPDTFTGDAFDSTAAFSAAQLLALIDDSLVGDSPTIRGGGGSDSFGGRVVADYAPLGGPVQIGAAGPAGSFAANTGGGNDTLTGAFGVILPDQDNAVSFGARSAVIEVTGGSNSIIAGDGAVLSYRQLTVPLGVDLSAGTASHGADTDTIGGIDNVIGGAGDDTISGNQEDNLVAPGEGSNVVLGGGGTDTAVFAMTLQAIVDPVYLFSSQRLLFATLGDGPAAVQALYNVESANFAGEAVAVSDLGRPAPDFDLPLIVLSAAEPVYLASPQNENILGDATGNAIVDQGGANRIDGQDGDDLIAMIGLVGGAIASAPPPASVTLPLAPPVGGEDELVGGSGNDSILAGPGADIVDGGDGDDLLAGDDGADSIAGQLGNDLILGGAGDDFLAGEAGNDTIFGEGGQDVLAGGEDDDRLHADGGDLAVVGAGGNDVLAIQGGTTGLSVIDLSADNQNQSGSGPAVSGIEGVDATLANAAVSLRGGVFDGAGSLLIGSAFNDSLGGGDGSDTLIGGPGDDLIDAGMGNDSIVLDAGNDTVSGGAGADDLAYRGGAGGAGITQVMDFTPGHDRVVLPDSLAVDGADALSQLTMTGDGATFLADTGAGILFVGVAAASFTAGDFLIVDSV